MDKKKYFAICNIGDLLIENEQNYNYSSLKQEDLVNIRTYITRKMPGSELYLPEHIRDSLGSVFILGEQFKALKEEPETPTSDSYTRRMIMMQKAVTALYELFENVMKYRHTAISSESVINPSANVIDLHKDTLTQLQSIVKYVMDYLRDKITGPEFEALKYLCDLELDRARKYVSSNI